MICTDRATPSTVDIVALWVVFISRGYRAKKASSILAR